MKKISFAIFIILALILSCEEKDIVGERWETSALDEFEITPINGGAIITYSIPIDSEIYYILAEYERDGEVFTEKSSIYKNSLKIEGFNTLEKVKVTLYKVNLDEQRSKPLIVEFTPLKSSIKLASESLKFATAFGGVLAEWENPSRTELGVWLMTKEDDKFETQEVYFSTFDSEKYTFRGFPDSLKTFAITFQDKWGNISDTSFYTTTPLFEELVPKPYADARATIPYDNITELSSTYKFTKTWDGVVGGSNGFLSKSGNDGLSVTWDLKKVTKLSRMILWPYYDPFDQVNVMVFEIWGIDKLDPSTLPPADKSYWLDEWSVRNEVFKDVPKDFILPEKTFKDDWQYLGKYEIERIDQIIPVDLEAIRAILTNGHHFDFPMDAKPVRYIRFFVREGRFKGADSSPPSNNYFSLSEISFFGDFNVNE